MSEKKRSLWDRIQACETEIISEEIKDNMKIWSFRMSNGTTVTCREPIHTPEEQQKINDKFVEACMAIVYPDVDLSQVKKMTLICD